MSKIAYKDKEKTKKCYAQNETDLKHIYYCINPDCQGQLKLTIKDGTIKYFQNYKNLKSHINGCWGSKTYDIRKNYDVAAFNPNDFFENLYTLKPQQKQKTHPTNHTSSHKPSKNITTILEVFMLYNEANPGEIIAEITKNDIICDQSNNELFSEGINGNKIVECRYKNYDPDTNEIFFHYPAYSSKATHHIMTVHIKNTILFKEINKLLFNNRTYKMLVSGRFIDNKVEIITEKQIVVLKSKK